MDNDGQIYSLVVGAIGEFGHVLVEHIDVGDHYGGEGRIHHRVGEELQLQARVYLARGE